MSLVKSTKKAVPKPIIPLLLPALIAVALNIPFFTFPAPLKNLRTSHFFTVSSQPYSLIYEECLADIVVAHCRKNLSWLEEATREIHSGPRKIRNVYIYSMCEVDPLLDMRNMFLRKISIRVKNLPNRRNDLAFIYHIVSNFKELVGLESIFFLKDSMVDYPIEFLRKLRVPFREASENLSLDTPFVCFQRPDAGGMKWHRRREAWKFRLSEYATADKFGTTTMDRDYRKANVTMCKFLHNFLGNLFFGQLQKQEYIQVCYGGSFAVLTSKLTKVPLKVWKRLFAQLNAHENAEVQHYMERTWASLLSSLEIPITVNTLLANKSHLLFRDESGKSYPGMLSRSESHSDLGETVSVSEGLQGDISTILLISHDLTRTGAPVYLLQVARVLINQGKNIILISPSDGSLSKEFREIGARVIIWKNGHWNGRKQVCAETFCPTIAELFLDFVKAELSSFPRLIIWNTIVWADILSLLGTGRYCSFSPQSIWIIHEFIPEGTNPWKHFKAISSETSLRHTILGIDAIVFCSDIARRQWLKFDGLTLFYTLPGFSAIETRSQNSSKAITRESLDIPKNAFVVTVVGTLCLRKQQHWAIDSVAVLRQKGINAILLIIGDLETEKEFVLEHILPRQQRLGKDVIRLIPEQSRVAPYLRLADLHISASKEESYPLNTLEAMALSVPVVATRAGGTEEQFPPEAAWMVSPVDHNEFLRTVYRAATTKQLARHGEALSNINKKNMRDFEEKVLQIIDATQEWKRDHLECGMLVHCTDDWWRQTSTE